MTNLKTLPELEEAILRHIQSRSSTHEAVINKFTSEDMDEALVENAISELYTNRHYITVKPLVKAGIYSFGQKITEADQADYYVITLLGKNYLAGITANFTSFSNITNSNVAHQSSNVTQSINISELPQDIQEKVKELELAVLKKDSSGIKKAFGYIADKAVDVAIAIVTRRMLQ